MYIKVSYKIKLSTLYSHMVHALNILVCQFAVCVWHGEILWRYFMSFPAMLT